MASTKIRLLMIITLLSAFTALPMAANSALVNPITGGNGVTGGGNWTTGVSLGWSVAGASDNYLYSYTFQAPSQGSVRSHVILETRMNFESNNIWGNSNGYKLKAFSPKGPGNSNPGLPGSLYGLKYGGFGSTEGSYGEWNFNFTSDRAPMGGDFYAKGGNDTFADNSGFGVGEGGKGAKIVVSDTVTNQDTLIQRISISEPGTLLLFGSGLLGITVWRRRRKRMQN
jgi:hypothetical protein